MYEYRKMFITIDQHLKDKFLRFETVRMNPRKKRRAVKNKDFESAAESSLQGEQISQNHTEELHTKDQSKKKMLREQSQSVLKNGEQQTAMQSQQGSYQLPQPYEFLKFANPPLHTIFFPHFGIYTVTFWLSVLLLILFIVLLIFNYTKPQNDFTWNCSLYQLQNKFFPKLRYSFEFWRVPISGFFHSNIAHFCLNVFGLQMYGYFVEWYYGKLKLVVSLVGTILVAHFFAAAVDNLSISTMASSLLYCVIALKIWFLFEYRNYKPLDFRRIMICLLLGLITAINLIPIFVVNNVDFTSHLGGFLVGGLIGTFFHFRKQEENLQTDQQRSQYPKVLRVVKWGSLVLLAAFFVASISVVFATDTQTLYAMNVKIDQKCKASSS